MNFYINALSTLPIVLSNTFKVSWTAPSNIALVKYWGKHGKQLPCNPSLSFALENSTTTTTITFSPSKSLQVNLKFEGEDNEKFRLRLEKFFASLGEVTHFFKNMHVEIETSNTFPHSAGIASSASSMAAVALCITSLIYHQTEKEDDDSFFRIASYMARLGSGSASRSVFGGYSVWGHANILSSSDEFAVPLKGYDPIFTQMNDAIMIVSSKEKKISSTLGHTLMTKNPFADIRYVNAHKNLARTIDAMKAASLQNFFSVVEQEALEIHAMMMVSTPPFILMEPNSLVVISRIKEFRAETNIPIGYTIDAGPNIHILFFDDNRDQVIPFIETLRPYCDEGRIIFDRIGAGPVRNY